MEFCEKVQEFLDVWKGGTKAAYRSGLNHFQQYYGSIKDFLLEYNEDQQRPPLERENVGQKQLKGFLNYLKQHPNEYSNNTIRTYLAAVQSLFQYVFNETLTTKYLDVPNPTTENRKYSWNSGKPEEVQRFLTYFSQPRIKSITVSLYQTGLSLSDLLLITWDSIKEQYTQENVPICIRGRRIKTNVAWRSFLGQWAYHHLKTYFQESGKPSPGERIYTVSKRTVERKFRTAAQQFLGEFEKMNPCRPHSLRSAFTTRLTDVGMRDLYIEYFTAHNLTSNVQKKYQRRSDKKWREIYAQYEYALTPQSLWEQLGVQPP